MNRLRDTLRMMLDEQVLFYGYRWLAWGGACVSLALPNVPVSRLPSEVWLLALTFMFNLMATALAHTYVQVARRRPFLLAIDLLASIALVWASGGGLLPFFPYALGALVLPTLQLGWRSLGWAAALALLDTAAPWVTFGEPITTDTGAVALRLAAPFVFVVLCMALVRLGHQVATTPTPHAPQHADQLRRAMIGLAPPPPRPASMPRITMPLAPPRRGAEQPAPDTTISAPMATLSGSEREAQNLRRVLYALTPTIPNDLPAAIEQLAASFGNRSALATRTAVIGSVQVLPPAQHMTMLRLAQEALLNVQQHAHAHSALITLRYDPRQITLTIQDDGVGLLDGTHERPGVHALRAIGYRLAEIDGTLEVSEGESGGVTVRATAPFC